ncbi:MAG: hypothetical protein ACSHX6_06755 [Akkermansiaceae bacterium]
MPKLNPSSDTFWGLSEGYLDAADSIFNTIRSGRYLGQALIPCVFSYFRSIELSLKAVLVAHNVSERDITRTLGHRISNLIEKTESFVALSDIGISPEYRTLLDKFSDSYSSKGFEYPNTFWDAKPNLEKLKKITDTIVKTVQTYKQQLR